MFKGKKDLVILLNLFFFSFLLYQLDTFFEFDTLGMRTLVKVILLCYLSSLSILLFKDK